MMAPRLLLGSAVGLILAPGIRADEKPGAAAAQAPTAAAMRPVAERGLAAVEREGLAWWKVRKCNGCHHGGFLLWTHYEAERRGFDVDAGKLQAWTKQAFDFYLAKAKDHRANKNGHVEGMSILLGRPAPATADAEEPPPLKTVADLVALAQHDDGSYKYAGQPLHRSDAENVEVTTLWSILTLAPFDRVAGSYVKQREQSLGWLRKVNAGDSNEAVVLRLLVEHKVGEAAKAKALLEQLQKQQNADGGWSWTKGRPSEAYATGQSLYALGQMGLGENDAAVQRAWAFLASRQKQDGAWDSPTRKPNAKDNPIAAYWGTAWATLGLVRTLPDVLAKRKPR